MSAVAAVKPLPFLIGGEWVQDTSSHITHVNPATGEVNYEVCAGTAEHIDAAVQVAHKAANQPEWRNMLPHNRAQLLHRIADLMMERSDLLARCQMLENGKVWKECKNQVINGAATFRYCAAAIETLGSEITPPRGNYLSMTVYEPWGVVAAITPWNSPITHVHSPDPNLIGWDVTWIGVPPVVSTKARTASICCWTPWVWDCPWISTRTSPV